MNPEAAKAVRDALVDMIQGEHAATCQTLAAVTEAGKDYTPDPKSRSAWAIAKHIATSDVWFVDCIAAGTFSMDPAAAAQADAAFKTPADVVSFYQAALPAKLEVLKAQLHRFHEQPQHPSPGAVGRLPARARFQGAEHLRPERGRGTRRDVAVTDRAVA